MYKRQVLVSSLVQDLRKATHIILPGVGAFESCLNGLIKTKARSYLEEMVLEKKKPFLGICVGMQMLDTKGFENGEFAGLDWISGEVNKINNPNNNLKIPHMGWNSLSIYKNNDLFNDITTYDQFYFVHSYFFDIKHKKNIICNTKYGINIPAVVNQDNIHGFQFHPEKSGISGLKILYNWLKVS